jgi:UDP-N-acetylglucosamine:LPS N-acetylglucosamine transferase
MPAAFHSYPDANKSQPLKLALTAVRVAYLIARIRPDVIVSTGAAGGGLAVIMGRWLGIRTLFVDSIANAKELSVSAKLALRAADAVFTQWPKVAAKTPAQFRGSVL